MRIAVEGCAHGELEKIYETIEFIEKEQSIKVDLLLCCGDFQAVRNPDDLMSMAVPKKYLEMGTFYKYYSGEKVAPIPTIYIGGNHEAMNHHQELPYGGWVAPNIYYLGYAGVINVNGIRIGGLSGIYYASDYRRGHHEYSPFTYDMKRSSYHLRQMDVYKMMQLTPGKIDILLSHEWPRRIYKHGNERQLVRFKPHFRDECVSETLGAWPLEELLKTVQPEHWFAAHLHCKFSALVEHEGGNTTKFLALDKVLPKRRFLQILELNANTDDGIKLQYDPEWLAILQKTNNINGAVNPNFDNRVNQEEIDCVMSLFDNNLSIPNNFEMTVPPYNPATYGELNLDKECPPAIINPQNKLLCDILRLDDAVTLHLISHNLPLNYGTSIVESKSNEEESIEAPPKKRCLLNLPEPVNIETPMARNPDEMNIDSDSESNHSKSDNELDTPKPQVEVTSPQCVEGSTAPKLFKQRNASVYVADD